MGTVIAIAVGGAFGSLARHGLAVYLEQWWGGSFPTVYFWQTSQDLR